MEPSSIAVAPATPVEGRFIWGGLVLTAVAAPVAGLLGAWVGDVNQAYFAPILLFPILLGMFVGLGIVALVRFAQIGHRPTVFFGLALAALVAAVGQHYIAYLLTYHSEVRTIDAATVSPQDVSALVRNMMPGFGDYMSAQARSGRPLPHGYVAYGWAAWLSWSIDALLLLAAAVVVAMPALRVPYCNRCRSWYRIIRNGKIDLPTALRLTELIGIEGMDSPRSPRYRLSACQSGCGPTRCEVSWEDARGGVSLVRVWLDAAARNQVTAILDGLEMDQPLIPNP